MYDIVGLHYFDLTYVTDIDTDTSLLDILLHQCTPDDDVVRFLQCSYGNARILYVMPSVQSARSDVCLLMTDLLEAHTMNSFSS